MGLGMNLEKIISPQIQYIVPKHIVSLYIFASQVNDDEGRITPTYTIISNVWAQIQFTGSQSIKLIDGFSTTKIYRDFRIQSTSLTGLNRNISTAGDYILYNGLYHRIVQLHENFLTGWLWVTACEGGALIGDS